MSAAVHELEQRRNEVLAEVEATDIELTSLRDQIERAKIEQAATGRYADRDWWVRVNSRLRHRGRDRQALQTRLGTLGRELKAARHRENANVTEDIFVSVARERLPADVFSALMQATLERKAAAHA